MEKAFTAATGDEANRLAEEWAKQQRLRILYRTNVQTGGDDSSASLLDRDHWTVTIHCEQQKPRSTYKVENDLVSFTAPRK
jgi:hypothetical protein